MFTLGKRTLRSNIFCAPLAGCSDLPFRRMTASYRPGLIFCEMVKMDALIRFDPNTFHLLDYEESMHPIGAQLCGSKPAIAGRCAKIVEELGFDTVDLNCGCPVDKVTKDGSGSGMLKNPELIGEVISEMKAAVNIPVTVKIRIGWDEGHINAQEIVPIAEKAGADAITIHGRTRAQGYQGAANWDVIRDCKAVAKNIKVIGNGDLFDATSALNMLRHTQCDGILLARGILGQPWLVEDVQRALQGLPAYKRMGSEYREALLRHMEYVEAYQAEKRAVLDMRRVGCWYLKRGKGAKRLREAINKSKTLSEMHSHVISYPWEELDFSTPEPVEAC